MNKKCKAEPNSPTLSDDAKQQSRTRTENNTPQGEKKKKPVQHLKFEPKTHVYCCAAMSYKKTRKTAIQSAKNEGNKSRGVKSSRTVSAFVYYKAFPSVWESFVREKGMMGKDT